MSLTETQRYNLSVLVYVAQNMVFAVSCQTRIEELEERMNHCKDLFQNLDDESIESYEQARAKWASKKGELLSEEKKFKKLMKDFEEFIRKEKDVNEWLKKTEEIVASLENIEDGQNAEDLFKMFEVCVL